jgi:hypothetical protein
MCVRAPARTRRLQLVPRLCVRTRVPTLCLAFNMNAESVTQQSPGLHAAGGLPWVAALQGISTL